jgi:hypothetical protein
LHPASGFVTRALRRRLPRAAPIRNRRAGSKTCPTSKTNARVHWTVEEGEKHWTDFQNDPEWKKVSAESEANGKLVLKIERVWLDPTEFSGLK